MSDEKKIIVDEDWKGQVAAEKEAAARQAGRQPNEAASAGGPSGADLPPIEASFDLLVTSFVTEAMVALGQIPHPASGQQEFDPHHARFAIDMLDVIAEKTKGNLAPEEDRGLQEVIHQLRMAFVAISNQQSAVGQSDSTTSASSG
jgi:hypothetical protein